MRNISVGFFALYVLIFPASCSPVASPPPAEVAGLESRLQSSRAPAFVSSDKQKRTQWQTVIRLYEGREFRPIWFIDGKAQPQVETLTHVLDQAIQHGLETRDYAVDLEPSEDFVDRELRLTWAFVQFGFDIADAGKPVEQALAQAIEKNSLFSIVDVLPPKEAEYTGLQRVLQIYRQLPGNEEWATLPLEVKLRMLGDLDEKDPPSNVAEGIRRFKVRHGLAGDAKPDQQFAATINVSPRTRIHQITTNMERLRQLPENPGERYVWVNIPAYSLTVFESGREALSMAVVVGKAQTPTPTLSAEMTQLIFSPYWNIPESILTKETLPKVFEDQNYLSKQNIEIVRVSRGKREVLNPSAVDWANLSTRSDYHFRQRPGPGNSLGLVKFIFPNPYSVYLHDTPADSLFNLAERDFSHGCVRVEQPLELASYLLSDQPQWPRDRIETAMHSGNETAVQLKQKVPVYFVYLTAWGSADGTVHFRKDIYNRDKGSTT